jgi:hypothetical protein
MNPPYRRCPHYPRKRTWEARLGHVGLGQKRTCSRQSDSLRMIGVVTPSSDMHSLDDVLRHARDGRVSGYASSGGADPRGCAQAPLRPAHAGDARAAARG